MNEKYLCQSSVKIVTIRKRLDGPELDGPEHFEKKCKKVPGDAGAAAGATAGVAAASAAAIDATTTFVVVKTMAAAEAAAATPAAAASLYQYFQVDTKGLKLNGGHFVHDNFKHLAPNPDA